MKNAASVLIVDDEPSIRMLFRTALESAGYEVVEAGDGVQALGQVHDAAPDVVLLDLKMPGMNGMETLRRLRDQGADTPVVIVTAHGSIADAVAAMKLGAVDFLTKPVLPKDLRRTVSEVILRHNRPAPPRGHGPPADAPTGGEYRRVVIAGRGSRTAGHRPGPREAHHQRA